ncbi:unnamed protein product [Lymnaea stagnalis]|uniref:Uncharacterized protein n=1 Tax=Lymnaea stagnalis TaxID=6523 RepID=A0AAV2I1Z9_LYMST
MTGAFQQLEKESFWKEHQDTLVKVRQELQSGKKSRYGTPGGVRKRTPNGKSGLQPPSHPPYGKYRRTPSPYLPKISPEPQRKPAQQKVLAKKVFDVVPPLKPKKAFLTSSAEDYDSWGEESDDEDEYDYEKIKSMNRRRKATPVKQKRRLKPQPYPVSMQAYVQPQVVYGVPFPVYYPPPPARKGKNQREKYDRNTRKVHKNKSGIPVMKKRKSTNVHPSMPMFTTFYPDMSDGGFGSTTDKEEGTEEEDLMVKLCTKSALSHWKKHPLFASDFCTWFIDDCLNTELLPDLLIDTMNEIKYMPHDHPLYLPSLYTCEDILSDHVSEMVLDIVRETAGEIANDYLDEKRLKRDPLEDFLTGIIEDVVQAATREVVRSTVINLAEDYVENEYATGVIQSLLKDYVREIGPDLLEEITFDLIAEDFIGNEVIAPEVQEEAVVIAMETIQYYDDKVLKRQLKEVKFVSQQAHDVLADSIIMEYLLSMMSQHGKLWAETDHQNKYLDDLILNTSLTQIFNIQKQRQKTVQCKPLQKLHEKVVSDVALDVFLQYLTRTLDEDLADVDEYERDVTDDTSFPFPLAAR